MHTISRDRVTRGLFATSILAAHVLLVGMLSVRTDFLTTPASKDSAGLFVLLPGDTYENGIASRPPEVQPLEIHPQRLAPQEFWAPTVPDIPVEDVRNPLPMLETKDLSASIADAASGESGMRDTPAASNDSTGIAIVQRVMPEYPSASMRAGEQGGTVLQVRVDESGQASEVRIARSSGYPRLDESAVRAVRQWKFAAATKDALAVPAWGELELRFNLYRFTLSRINDAPHDLVPPGQIAAGASEAPVPGGEAALRLLMDEVRASESNQFGAAWPPGEMTRLKEVLTGWGDAELVQYRGAVAGNRWRTYEIKPEFRKGRARETVELRWDMYEVSHDHGTSEWRIAVDRNGNIWCAHAGSRTRPPATLL
jgi:TonB family protein